MRCDICETAEVPLKPAIIVRCASKAGQCRRRLALGYPTVGNRDHVMWLTNEGTPAIAVYPLLEALVPASFDGGCDTILCTNALHNDRIIDDESDSTPTPSVDGPPDEWRSLSGRLVRLGKVEVTGGLAMPYSMLAEPFARFRITGDTQVVGWSVETGPTVSLASRHQ